METNIITIDQMMKDAKHITSLEIASLVGKPHNDVLKAIRKMEKAWEQECGGNFPLTSEKVNMPQGGVRLIPVFSLTKTECLYVATKFNDAARARLVLRWEELEKDVRCKKDEGRCGGQKLLVTEKEILQQGDAIRRQQIGEENAPAVGDKVKVTGKLTKYNGTPEFAAGLADRKSVV